MAITFNCPNGHRLTCPEQQAGKPGKCPKCGTVFRVPASATPTAAPVAAAAPERPATGPATAGAAPVETQAEAGAHWPALGDGDGGANEIVFLCPNGHRLHGPAALAGRPGQCPECGIRFLIPSAEDVSDDAEEQILEEEAEDQISPEEIFIQIDTSPRPPSGTGSAIKRSPPASSPPTPSLPPAGEPPSPHPLAALVGRLWAIKGQGDALEIHFADGNVLIPDEFAKQQPYNDYGVFSVRSSGGSHTLTVVAWDSVARVTLRGLEHLPEELFGRAAAK